MSTFRVGGAKWDLQPWNGLAHLANVVPDAAVFYNTTAVTFYWNAYPGATYYHVQVSLFPDFRSSFVDTSITAASYAFTDSQVNDAKRYWRWRPSVTVGANFLQPWSDVGSYWLNTGAGGKVTLAQDEWIVFDKDDVSDTYFFDMLPLFTVTPSNLYRFTARNRAGALLTEFLTVKNDITLDFNRGQFVNHNQVNELQRFHNSKRVYFLACYARWQRDQPMPQIWKVECAADPVFRMMGAGRPDLLQGSIEYMEV